MNNALDWQIYVMSAQIVGKLRQNGLWLSVAESCTGGALGAALTAIEGSSTCFGYGIISYSNQAKIELLNVDPEILTKYTAVSRETALAMAEGVQKLSGSDISLSITGYAGPDGGDAQNPLGTVYFGVIYGQVKEAFCRLLDGDREEIRKQAVLRGLTKLYDMI